jgi:tRNA(fMet)-specific endonuclease VapC
MRYMLDTNICVYAMKGSLAVKQHLLSHRRSEIAISVLTEAELRFGGTRSEKRRVLLERMLAGCEILDFTSVEAEVYASLRAALERVGTPIGPLDLLIAAHAKALDLVLVTNNEREFRRVPGLRVENWAD